MAGARRGADARVMARLFGCGRAPRAGAGLMADKAE
jgi:hypothetical protein